MAIKITVSDKVGFTVQGTINDADGTAQAFDFSLTAKRLDEDAINALQAALVLRASKEANHAALIDELTKIVTNWSGVRDESDAPLAYTPELLTQLLTANRGLAMLVWRTYLADVGAKEKN